MDIFSLLKQDHNKVSTLFKKCEATTGNAVKTRQELFEQIHSELDAHAQVEERLFYPRLEGAIETRPIVQEAYIEHGKVKQLLAELEQIPVESEAWTAKMRELQRDVEAHVKEEENDLFPKARRVLGDETAEDIADQAEALKKDLGL